MDVITSLDLAVEEAKSGRPAQQQALGEFVETVEDGKTIKRWRIPACEFRGAVLKRGEPKPCCGGKLTIEELFACLSPFNTLKDAWSTRCRDCVYPKTRTEQNAWANRETKPVPPAADPYDQNHWPEWVRLMAKAGDPGKDAGVGDTVHRIIGDYNSQRFSDWHKEKFGEPCKCPERQAEWNARWPYRRDKKPGLIAYVVGRAVEEIHKRLV